MTSIDILRMLAELRSERQQIDEAILVLQRLATSGGKRRGRPPKWMAAHPQAGASTLLIRKRKPFSAATRKRMAAAQRRRWAARNAKGT